MLQDTCSGLQAGPFIAEPAREGTWCQRTARPGRLPSPAETSPRTQAPGPRVIGVSHSHSHVLTLKTRACGLVLTNKDLQDLLGGFKIVKTSTVSLFRFSRKFSLSLALGQSLRPTSEALQDTARATRAHPSEGPVTSAGAMRGAPQTVPGLAILAQACATHGPPGKAGCAVVTGPAPDTGFQPGRRALGDIGPRLQTLMVVVCWLQPRGGAMVRDAANYTTVYKIAPPPPHPPK